MEEQTFGKLLRECRKRAKLTQLELAKSCNFSDGSMISRFESANTIPNSQTLQLITTALEFENIERDTLDQLWILSYHQIPKNNNANNIFPNLEFAKLLLNSLDNQRRSVLQNDLKNFLELQQKYKQAQEIARGKNWDEAVKKFLKIQEEMGMLVQRWNIRINQNLGHSYYSRGSFGEAIWHFEIALMTAKAVGKKEIAAKINNGLGDVHRRFGGADRCKKARKHYNDAREIYESIDDKLGKAKCFRRIAGSYVFEGLPLKAIEYCKQSEKICISESDKKGHYKVLQHFAWVYCMIGQWGKAIEKCEEAYEMIPKDKDPKSEWEQIKGLRYLGDVYRVAREYDKAEEYYNAALQLFGELKKSRTYGLTLLGLSKILIKQQDREYEAKQKLDEGFSFHGGVGDDFRAIDYLVEEGQILIKIGEFDDAKIKLNYARDKYWELRNYYHYFRAQSSLCYLYYEMGDAGIDNIISIATEISKIISKEAKEVYSMGILDYHLAQINFYYGSARAKRGLLPAATRAWHYASEKAINFNTKTFEEIINKFNNESIYLEDDVKDKLIRSVHNFWQEKVSEFRGDKEKYDAINNAFKSFGFYK